jgi:alpha-L-fucosidase
VRFYTRAPSHYRSQKGRTAAGVEFNANTKFDGETISLMAISRRRLLKTGAAAAVGLALYDTETTARAHAETGPFEASWESLEKYECPEWFRDAKFGIWAHWTAQCVPEQGDWYARQMYQEGNHDYKFQCEHYGHPSKVGFKDIDHLWHAENWDPAKLMSMYKAAGAKYFVALAQHHDNFDCWDSKYQSWNSVALGPKKNIVGTWAKEARKNGLRFGVTSHGSHAWSWFEVSQGADKTGPLAGVPYDGKLTKADGKGTWWEGLDPQELYAQNHTPGPGGLQWTWDAAHGSSTPDKAYCDKFYNRTIDLLDKYQPDLLYFDDTVLPLYQVDPSIGLKIAAHHYNASVRRGKGKVDAVLNGKGLNDEQRKAMVDDFERGRSANIVPHPWQTDTCIGQWHYDRSVYTNHRYKTTNQVVKMLVDIVSKNGNLLLNVPLRGDGTIDPDEVAFLEGMAAWMKVNDEAIFKTRPWKISGEGPVKVRGGGFSEGGEEKLTAADFRFTTRGNTLYATAMAWPETGKLVLRTLADGATGLVGDVKSVELLGAKGDRPFKRTADGLEVTLPDAKPCDHAYVLKITGLDVAASQPVAPHIAAPRVHPAADGTVTLNPDTAELHGAVQTQAGAVPNIGYWDNPADSVSWDLHFDHAGTYHVVARTAASTGETAFTLDAGTLGSVTVPVPKTASWDAYVGVNGGDLVVKTPGDYVLTVRPADKAKWKPMNLAFVALRPAP